MELLNLKMQLTLRNGMQPRKQLIRKRQMMIKRKRMMPKPKPKPLNQLKHNLQKLSLMLKKKPRNPPLQSKILKQR
jgi:hypothetical protein